MKSFYIRFIINLLLLLSVLVGFSVKSQDKIFKCMNCEQQIFLSEISGLKKDGKIIIFCQNCSNELQEQKNLEELQKQKNLKASKLRSANKNSQSYSEIGDIMLNCGAKIIEDQSAYPDTEKYTNLSPADYKLLHRMAKKPRLPNYVSLDDTENSKEHHLYERKTSTSIMPSYNRMVESLQRLPEEKKQSHFMHILMFIAKKGDRPNETLSKLCKLIIMPDGKICFFDSVHNISYELSSGKKLPELFEQLTKWGKSRVAFGVFTCKASPNINELTDKEGKFIGQKEKFTEETLKFIVSKISQSHDVTSGKQAPAFDNNPVLSVNQKIRDGNIGPEISFLEWFNSIGHENEFNKSYLILAKKKAADQGEQQEEIKIAVTISDTYCRLHHVKHDISLDNPDNVVPVFLPTQFMKSFIQHFMFFTTDISVFEIQDDCKIVFYV